MAKQITIEYKDNIYTLEFTRKSIQQMEKQGFRINEIETKPMTMIPQFFAGAFICHHRNIKPELIDEIFDNIEDKNGLIEVLGQMYAEPLEALFDTPANEGNATWGVKN